MSTTAANPALTSASQRQSGKPSTKQVGQKAGNVEEQRYSHRQSKGYRKNDLKHFEVPELTIKDLLSSIPSHCFERSAIRSGSYVLGDFIMIAALGYAASFIDPSLKSVNFEQSPLTPFISAAWQHSIARFSLWFLYTVLQGLVFTGVWVIAHECGHQAFSASKTINNTVGWFLHSALLVPYHSWRISHARHHAATGHMTRDEVFVPRTRQQKGLLPLRPSSASDAEDDANVERQLSAQEQKAAQHNAAHQEETWGEWLTETLEDAPLYNFIFILVQQSMGWPLYLLLNSSGQLHYPKNTNHFDPNSIIFDARHRSQVLMSDLGIAITLTSLATWAHYAAGGWADVAKYYIVPYLWCNHWLVMITYLQHTDPVVPHYKPETWNFVRGALCTVDRKWLGPVGPFFLHGIAETHVLHHVSSKIPHYHAWEASEALKKRLGEHYQSSDENVFVSLWKSIRKCKFVDENDQVAFFRDAHGVPSACVAPNSAYNSDSGVTLSE
ncbi:hypothetical protein L7F22_050261 [Adiantum nelumboides]|nr:hypothetical protein [Adiantum nelumboides]